MLEAQLRTVVADASILRLLHQRLYRTVEDGGLYHDITQGLARGNPLSSFLGALYLKALGVRLKGMGMYYLRYMDDILLLTRTHGQLRWAARVLNQQLKDLHLEKHPDKTFIGRIERGFDFLGYAFSGGALRQAQQTLQLHAVRRLRCYEQQIKKKATPTEVTLHLEAYATRGQRWSRVGLESLISQAHLLLLTPMAAVQGHQQGQSG